MAYQDHQIAAGHDNAAGLVNIEDITDGSGYAFLFVRSVGQYVPGELVPTLNVSIAVLGVTKITWTWAALRTSQYEYLKDTYGGGGYTGLVTIRTTTTVKGTYANYNARMLLKPEAELQWFPPYYRDVAVDFIDLEAL